MTDYAWARPNYDDIPEIVDMADLQFGHEVNAVLQCDRKIFTYNLARHILLQEFDPSQEFLAVARSEGRIIAYTWCGRNCWTTYSPDEMAEVKFIHCEQSLPAKTRIRLVNESLDQMEIWCRLSGIPVLVSTSIRGDYQAFMKIHQRRGYTVHGSYAYLRIIR